MASHVRQPMVQVQLPVRRAREAIEFYMLTFGAEEIYRFGGTDDQADVVCQLTADGASFWVEDGSPPNGKFSPETLGGWTERLLLISEEPDATVRRAIAMGATEVRPHTEERGWLLAHIVDFFGYRWEIGRTLGPWPPSEKGNAE